jgi:hypothetical protein
MSDEQSVGALLVIILAVIAFMLYVSRPRDDE